MKSFKKIFMIISSIIGAGFISGKEIFVYFSSFGIYSLFFIIPLFFLFYFYIFLILKTEINKNIEYLKSKVFFNKKTYNIFSFFSFSIISSTMFAGINSVFEFEINSIEFFILNLFIILFCIFAIFYGVEKFSKINMLIFPIVIIFFLISMFAPQKSNQIILSTKNLSLLPFSLLSYVCNNVFISHYVILETSKDINIKQAKHISFACSLILCVLISICIVFEINNPDICQLEMPLLEISKNISPAFYNVFCILMCYCIFSTLFSTLVGMIQFFNFKYKVLNIIFPTLLCFIISLFGFSNFVVYIYPLIGIIGFVMLYRLISTKQSMFKLSFQNSNKNIHK